MQSGQFNFSIEMGAQNSPVRFADGDGGAKLPSARFSYVMWCAEQAVRFADGDGGAKMCDCSIEMGVQNTSVRFADGDGGAKLPSAICQLEWGCNAVNSILRLRWERRTAQCDLPTEMGASNCPVLAFPM